MSSGKPRNTAIQARLSEEEERLVQALQKVTGMSRSQIVVHGVGALAREHAELMRWVEHVEGGAREGEGVHDVEC